MAPPAARVEAKSAEGTAMHKHIPHLDVVLLLQEARRGAARRGAARRGAVRIRPPRAPWPRWTPPAPVRPRRRLLLLDPDPVLSSPPLWGSAREVGGAGVDLLV